MWTICLNLRTLFERKEFLLLFIAGIILVIVMYLPFVKVPVSEAPLSGARPVAMAVGADSQDVALDPYVFKPMIVADVSPEIDLKRPEIGSQGPVTKCARPTDVLGPGMTGQSVGSTSGYK
jgi:hypothetical protein